jgi:putative transposase
MLDIMIVLGCVSQCLDTTAFRPLTRLIEAMLSMSGRVTMLGISRWTGPGGSDRTVQRFFNRLLDWGTLQWLLIRSYCLDDDDVILASGDHGGVTKSGKQTHGLDRFFSSLYGKPVPGLCFLCLSLMSAKSRKSYPVWTEQVEKPLQRASSAQGKETETTKKSQSKSKSKSLSHGRGGRPKGSQNRHRREMHLAPFGRTFYRR